jgi:hypothetical protein
MTEKTPQLPIISVRLDGPDYMRFERYCKGYGKTKTELCREAIHWWLDQLDKGIKDDGESKLEIRMDKMEERLGSLMIRSTVDIGVLYQAIYYNLGDKAEKAFPAFYKHAVERLKAKHRERTEIDRATYKERPAAQDRALSR